MAHSDGKPGGCSHSSGHFTFHVTDYLNESGKGTVYLQHICLYLPVFAKLVSEFNLNIYHLASYFWLQYIKIFFQRNTYEILI